MEPFILKPVGKDYIWGGNRLKEKYGKNLSMTPLAETWECSTHPDGMSTVASGHFKGQTLGEVIRLHPDYLGKRVADKSELPVLVKLIDAQKNLSIQVHPDQEYARLHENQNGKFEMWYVLDAKEDTQIIYGFQHNVSRELLESAIETGDLEKHLRRVHIRKNDVFLIPAGMIHAIGAGALIVEVQVSSNVTYRVYDYNRVGKDGRKRELHFDKAMDVLDMSAGRDFAGTPRLVQYIHGGSREILCRCEYFMVQRIVISGTQSWTCEDSFQILLCLEGEGSLQYESSGEGLCFSKGICIFIPAGIGEIQLAGAATLLLVKC